MRFFCTAYEKATKEQRMRTEISQAKREANFYIQNVEKGKAIEAMETRKRKRADQVGHVIFTLHLYSFDSVMAKGFKTRCETRPSGTGQNPQGSICLEGISYLSGDDKPELFFFLWRNITWDSHKIENLVAFIFGEIETSFWTQKDVELGFYKNARTAQKFRKFSVN